MFQQVFSSSFDRQSASGQLAEALFMPSQLGHGGRRHGDVLLEKIKGQLADGVDLIGVGVRQQVLALGPIGFVQDALKERPLALEAFHRENGRQAFTRILLSSSSSSFLLSGCGLQGSFHPVPGSATHGPDRRGLTSSDQQRDQGRQGQHASLLSRSSRASSSSCTSARGHARGFYGRGVVGPLSLYDPGSGMGLVMPSGAFCSQAFVTFFSSELQTQFDGNSQSAQ